MGSKPKKVPKPVDPLDIAGQQSGKLLGYYGAEVPKWLQLQEDLGPQLMAQMFGQTGQFLGGVGGQPGLEALQLSTSQRAGETLGQLRAGEIGQMTGQTGLARGLMEAMSPEQAAVVQGFASEAERARASAQGVTPEERRGYEQQSREGFQAAGRLGGNRSIVSEANHHFRIKQVKTRLEWHLREDQRLPVNSTIMHHLGFLDNGLPRWILITWLSSKLISNAKRKQWASSQRESVLLRPHLLVGCRLDLGFLDLLEERLARRDSVEWDSQRAWG